MLDMFGIQQNINLHMHKNGKILGLIDCPFQVAGHVLVGDSWVALRWAALVCSAT